MRQPPMEMELVKHRVAILKLLVIDQDSLLVRVVLPISARQDLRRASDPQSPSHCRRCMNVIQKTLALFATSKETTLLPVQLTEQTNLLQIAHTRFAVAVEAPRPWLLPLLPQERRSLVLVPSFPSHWRRCMDVIRIVHH